MKSANTNYGFSNKWSAETEHYGFTQVPNILITCQAELGLNSGELVTLIQLVSFWFHHEAKVFPSISLLAKRSGKGYSTTQRYLKSLEVKGFIQRKHVVNRSNDYNLFPCAIKLHMHQKRCESCNMGARKRGARVTKGAGSRISKTANKEYKTKRLKENSNLRNQQAQNISEIITRNSLGGLL